MRRLLLALLLAGISFSALLGRSLPLTFPEIALMLRSGFSSETVRQELSTRHLAGNCDAAAEKVLRDAGAPSALIDEIKGGAFASSPVDTQKAQQELAAQAAKRAQETERLRKFDTLYQDKLAQARASAPPPKSEAPPVLLEHLKGDLVFWKNGILSQVDDLTIGKKKLIALYYSARWCAPCRQFTPQLVEFYNRVTPEHPEFEIVFVSDDRSRFGMEEYLREMPWPAIEYEKVPGKTALKKLGGKSIPWLVVLDASGRVVLDPSKGPEKVLADLNALLSPTSPAPLAAIR